MEMPSLDKLRCGRNPDPDRLRRVDECQRLLTVRRWLAGDRPPELEGLDLDVTRPHFGGERRWFVCPRCRRRCGVLYQPAEGDGWACRRCHRLAYRSAQEAHQDEALWRAFERIDRHCATHNGWGDDDAAREALFEGLNTAETVAVCRAMIRIDVEYKRAAWEILATYPGRLDELDD